MNDSTRTSEFDCIKGKDEQILWTAIPKFVPFILTGLPHWIIILMNLFIYYCIFYHTDIEPPPVYIYISLAIILPLIPFFYRLFSYSNTLYGLSNKRIIIRTGFIKSKFKTINHNRIITFKIEIDIIERTFNTGSIRFFSGKTKETEEGIENVYDYWHAIENPDEVFKMLKQTSYGKKK